MFLTLPLFFCVGGAYVDSANANAPVQNVVLHVNPFSINGEPFVEIPHSQQVRMCLYYCGYVFAYVCA